MIRSLFALKLARTKLRSKRGVMIASVVVASLLFAALIAITIVFAGAQESATDYVKKAGNDRYLVKVTPYIPDDITGYSQDLSLERIREIKIFEKQFYKELKDKYQSLGLVYDGQSEVSALLPASWLPETLPEEQRVIYNWQSPVIGEMRRHKFEQYAKTADNNISGLMKIGSEYRASGYYIVNKPSMLPSIPGLLVVQNGKENFGDMEMKSGGGTTYGYYINSIHNGYYGFTDQKLLSRYLLTKDSSGLKGIPVIVSAQEAVNLFGEKVGITKEPKSATQKRAWIKSVQERMNGLTYQVCYRNSAEQEMIKKIQRDYVEIKNNQKTKGYQKPGLIYDYPAEGCGDIVIKSDSRSVYEKMAVLKMQEQQKKLGTYVSPEHRLLTFQIVGVKYAQQYADYTKGVDEYVKSLLVSQDHSMELDIPLQMYQSLPDKLKIDDLRSHNMALPQQSNDDFGSRVLEFATVEDARNFLDQQTCSDLEDNCDKKFKAGSYGSNYLILDEIGKLFNRVATIAFPLSLGLAAIIIWFTVSRIMAENRKETAIYRAMGARRHDIAAIYLVYVLLVASQIALVSLAIGTAAAAGVDYFYGQTLTDTAVAAFGIVDGAPRFSLFRVTSPLILVIVVSIFITSLIASIQPLIRNVRRNPIQDVRDDG